jgi:hypothetical protein
MGDEYGRGSRSGGGDWKREMPEYDNEETDEAGYILCCEHASL